MLPIIIDPRTVRVGLAGAGEGLARRRALLLEAGADPVAVSSESSDAALHCLSALFVAGLDDPAAEALAKRARAGGVLVNVEDRPELCNFHMPAIVRRGALMLSVSTGGKAPGLARRIREWLEQKFGAEWSARIDAVAEARALWRAEGLPPHEVSTRTRAMVDEKGWLP